MFIFSILGKNQENKIFAGELLFSILIKLWPKVRINTCLCFVGNLDHDGDLFVMDFACFHPLEMSVCYTRPKLKLNEDDVHITLTFTARIYPILSKSFSKITSIT